MLVLPWVILTPNPSIIASRNTINPIMANSSPTARNTLGEISPIGGTKNEATKREMETIKQTHNAIVVDNLTLWAIARIFDNLSIFSLLRFRGNQLIFVQK